VATETGGSPIKQVDYIGYYEDYDYNGDGIYLDWQYLFRRGQITRHIGSASSAPWSVVWDTSWVPDQAAPMKFKARIIDENGICYITPVVEGVTLQRPGKRTKSVKLCKPYDVPTRWQTRAGQTHTSKLQVDIDPSDPRVKEARLLIATWSGDHAEEIGLNGRMLINKIGFSHDYSLDEIPLPLHYLQPGENTVYTKSTTKEHGIEVMWPGPAVKIRMEAE